MPGGARMVTAQTDSESGWSGRRRVGPGSLPGMYRSTFQFTFYPRKYTLFIPGLKVKLYHVNVKMPVNSELENPKLQTLTPKP